MIDKNTERFNEFVSNTLKDAGWYPGRNMQEAASQWKYELNKSDDWDMFTAAESVLLEFGGLKIEQKGAGQTLAREPFEINPMLAIYEGDRFTEYSATLDIRLYPLGEASGGHHFLAIGEDGRVFVIMDDMKMIGRTFDEAITNLIVGIAPSNV